MQSDDFFLKIRSCSCMLEWQTTIWEKKVKRYPRKNLQFLKMLTLLLPVSTGLIFKSEKKDRKNINSR